MRKCSSTILYAACTFRPYKSTPVLKLFHTFTGKMTRGLSLRMIFSLLFQDTLFTAVLFYTIKVLPLYLYVVDSNRTQLQQPRPAQTEQQQPLEHKRSLHRQVSQTARMSRQLATLGGAVETPATPASIAGGTIEVGEKFRDSRALKVKVERVFLAQGRRCRLDKRVSGGQGKLIRCSGAIIVDGVKGATGCQARVRAYKGRSKNEWNITEAVLNHVQCTG